MPPPYPSPIKAMRDVRQVPQCLRQSPGMEGEDMNVSLKSLIGKLNDTCRGALEAAAGLCLPRTHYDVDIEHLLLKLSEVVDTDLQRILRHYEVEQARLTRDLTRALDRLKTGNARTPVLSPRLPQLFSEAWTL